jgi:hypothetical protein
MFQDAANYARDPGDYIANATPESALDKLGQASAREACKRWADDPNILDSPGKAVAFADVCRPYLEGEGLWPGESYIPPFTGGQCPIVYLVTVKTSSLASPSTTDVFCTGPVTGGIRYVTVSESAVRCDILVEGGAFWQAVRVISSDFPRDGGVVSVSPLSSGTDVCGNLPSVYKNPTPQPSTPITSYNDGDINVPVNISVNADGTIDIDINGDSGTVDPFSPPGVGEGGNPIPGNAETAGGGTGTGSGSSSDDTDLPEPEEGFQFIGLTITLSENKPLTGFIPNSSPYLIYPRIVGNVRLKLLTEDNQLIYDSPVPIKQQETTIWAPREGLKVGGFIINLLAGLDYDYTYYKAVKAGT